MEAGITRLRQRGVRGTDVQLAPIVEHRGRHALTIANQKFALKKQIEEARQKIRESGG